MFGDVGGEQAFGSVLTFVHGVSGELTQVGQKVSTHAFSPVRSTLALELSLPDKLVAGQPVEGAITYRNAGEVDFPEIAIAPAWPEGFALLSSDVPLREGAFTVPGVAAGESG